MRFETHALELADRGYTPIPLHWPISAGACSCMDALCGSPGKHPLVRWGTVNTDATMIREWSARWPNANLAIATGDSKRLVIIDIDEGGEGTVQSLEHKLGSLPDTLEVITGAGRHCYFRSDGEIPSSAGLLGPGLDVRSNRAYAVVPPSMHITGRVYRWKSNRGLCDHHIAALPRNWEKALQRRRHSNARQLGSLAASTIGIGQRNTSLCRLAGHLFRRRIDPLIASHLLHAFNKTNLSPPLPEGEVTAIVESIAGRELARRLEECGYV
jgi:hypothetical protein